MADDVQPITGTDAKIAARLCNFKTGFADLLPTHKAWLDANVKPFVQSTAVPWIDLYGYASRVGNAQANLALSQRRCETVKGYAATFGTNVNFPFDWGEGAQGPDPSDNDGYYRAVDVYVFGSKPVPKGPRIPRFPTKKIGSTSFQVRYAGGLSGGIVFVVGDFIILQIVDLNLRQTAFFLYQGAGVTVPIPKLKLPKISGASGAGPFVPFRTSTPVLLSSFIGQADVVAPPSITVGSASANAVVILTFLAASLSQLGAKVFPKRLTLGTGSGFGFSTLSATQGILQIMGPPVPFTGP